MMTSVWIVAAMATGSLLGTFYFGGLWLTVRRVPTTQSPALLLLVSFVVRTAVVVFGFFLVMGGRWERAGACMVGFLLARMVVIRRTHPVVESTSEPTSSLSTRRTTS